MRQRNRSSGHGKAITGGGCYEAGDAALRDMMLQNRASVYTLLRQAPGVTRECLRERA